MNGRILSASDRHVLVSAIRDREQNTVDEEEVISCLELVLHSVDPIYLPATERLVVNLSSTFEGSKAAGSYDRRAQHIWVASPQQPVSLSDRAYVLHTLCHEVAHHVHLSSDQIARPSVTSPGLTRERPLIGEYNDLEYIDLMQIKDEVFAVLHLGVDSENINYEEAVWLNKMILDMRIKHLYQKALESENYQSSAYWEEWGEPAYWRINHKEYWADASAAYLIVQNLTEYPDATERFPPRAWIKENDPGLYSLLGEVWSMAPYVALD